MVGNNKRYQSILLSVVHSEMFPLLFCTSGYLWSWVSSSELWCYECRTKFRMQLLGSCCAVQVRLNSVVATCWVMNHLKIVFHREGSKFHDEPWHYTPLGWVKCVCQGDITSFPQYTNTWWDKTAELVERTHFIKLSTSGRSSHGVVFTLRRF